MAKLPSVQTWKLLRFGKSFLFLFYLIWNLVFFVYKSSDKVQVQWSMYKEKMNALDLGEILHKDASIGLEVRSAVLHGAIGGLLVKRYSCSRYEEADCLLKEALCQVAQSDYTSAMLREVILTDGQSEGQFAVDFVYERPRGEILSSMYTRNDRKPPKVPAIGRYQLGPLIYTNPLQHVQVFEAFDLEAQIPVFAKTFGPYEKLKKANPAITEALIQGKIAHKHCTKIIDIWVQRDGSHFKVGFSLERLSSDVCRDIEVRKAQRRPYSEEELLSFLYQITSALIRAKSHGITHRNIKPESIFLSNEGLFKLGNFGSGWAAREVRTQSYQASRTSKPQEALSNLSSKMESDILRGNEKVDPFECDVYALGITFLEMATLHIHQVTDFAQFQQAITAAISSLKYSTNLKLVIREMLVVDCRQRPVVEQLFIGTVNLLKLQELKNPIKENCIDTRLTEKEQVLIIKALERFGETHYASQAYLAFSIFKAKENKLEEAVEWGNKSLGSNLAVSIESKLAICYDNLAKLYSDLGEMEMAEKSYSKFLDIMYQYYPENLVHFAACFGNLGNLYSSIGSMDEAEKYYMKCLDIRQRNLPEYHPHIADCYYNLGFLCKLKGNMKEAEQNYLKCLDIRQWLFPESHPLIADCYNHLGNLCKRRGTLKESEQYFLECLNIRQRLLPESHPCLAACFNNLKNLYSNLGKLKEEEIYCLKCIAIWRRILPEDHPGVADCFNNLAILCKKNGHLARAENFFFKCLRIRQQIFNENHPYIADCFYNLGNLYSEIDNVEMSGEYYQKCLIIRQRILPENHPLISSCFYSLGCLYTKARRNEEAENCYLRSISVQLHTSSENHYQIANSYNNLGILCKERGEFKEAEMYYLKSLSIRQTIHPEENSDVADCCYNLGCLYLKIGKIEDAESYYLQCYFIRKRILPENHPQIATCLNSLGNLYLNIGNWKEAKENYAQCLIIRKQMVPANQSGIADCYNNLGILSKKIGNMKKAEKYYLKCLEIRRQIAQEDSSQIADCLYNLGSLFKQTDDMRKAKRYYLECLKIRQKIFSENDSGVAACYYHLGNLCKQIRKHNKAKMYHTKCLRILKGVLPEKQFKSFKERLKSY